MVGGKILKCIEPLSEVREKVLVLGSGFRKRGEGKIDYYIYYVFGGFGFKAAVAKRMLLYFLTQGILDP